MPHQSDSFLLGPAGKTTIVVEEITNLVNIIKLSTDCFSQDWTDRDEQKVFIVGCVQKGVDLMDDAINTDVIAVGHVHPINGDCSLKNISTQTG